MKIKIEYLNEPHLVFNYFASTTYLGKVYSACSDVSFEDAKNKLLKQVYDKSTIPVPEPEEIEIKEN